LGDGVRDTDTEIAHRTGENPGVHTAGTAGNGRREYYGVRRTRRITTVAGQFRGADLGDLTALTPPVRFGFASAPADPQIVSVTTTIDVPA
jgi:hypothetical protein